jgi:NADH-quinone oxidoreductase subunit J
MVLQETLVFGLYAVAALGAAGMLAGLPTEGRRPWRGLMVGSLALAAGGVVLLLGRMGADSGRSVYFHALALLALGGGVRVATHPRPVYSALYFILVVLSTAALLFLVGAEFLGAALVIVYAGAILVTYVFVIMLAQQSGPRGEGVFEAALDYDRSAREPFAAVLAGFVLVATIAGVLVSRREGLAAAGTAAAAEGNTLALGHVLLSDFAISLELAGVLLMVAMVGAVALARKRLPRAEEGPAAAPGEAGRRVRPF